MNKSIEYAAICAFVLLLLVSHNSAALPIRDVPDLMSVTFWERTGGSQPTAFIFLFDSMELVERRADPLSPSNNDFSGAFFENYDIYYSDEDGTFNADGEYITIDAVWNQSLPSGGGHNIAEVGLNFNSSPTELGEFVSSFLLLGDNASPGSVDNSVDGDLQTHTRMGNTVGQTQRLRVTIGFASSVPVELQSITIE